LSVDVERRLRNIASSASVISRRAVDVAIRIFNRKPVGDVLEDIMDAAEFIKKEALKLIEETPE